MTWRARIQANIVRGLPAAKVEYRFLTFDNGGDLKRFVADVLPYVHDAAWQEQRFGRAVGPAAPGGERRQMVEPILNLAFTRNGIELVSGQRSYRSDDVRRDGLGVGSTRLPRSSDAFADRGPIPEALEALAREVAGIEPADIANSMFRRLDLLGEVPTADQLLRWRQGRNWRSHWLTKPIHVLVWASGPGGDPGQPGPTTSLIERLLRPYDARVITELSLTGRGLVGGVDHFGFVDGAGQPAIAGVHQPAEWPGRGALDGGRWRALRPGEFVVGQPDEGDEIRNLQPANILHNSTFLVFRQIEMRPDAFSRFLQWASTTTGAPPDTIASWMMGRHRRSEANEGTSLMVPGPVEDLDFIYGYDPEGLRCPLGAHVRRANPRDALGGDGARVNRHRIIRRGMPYQTTDDRGRVTERGLAFLAMQARIEDQFEFIQSRWLNTGGTLQVGNDPDPFAGVASSDADGPRFVHQGAPPTVLPLPTGDDEFTVVRGGEYFVMPSLPGLYALVRY